MSIEYEVCVIKYEHQSGFALTPGVKYRVELCDLTLPEGKMHVLSDATKEEAIKMAKQWAAFLQCEISYFTDKRRYFTERHKIEEDKL